MKMDTSKLCRSCMKEVASWEKENFDHRAVEMFCFCTNMQITQDDILPKQFCYDCIIKIESSYTYITEAHRVDAALKNIVSRSITSIIVEPVSFTKNSLKLTLPDYKVCSTADNFDEQVLIDTIDVLSNDLNHATQETTEELAPQNAEEEMGGNDKVHSVKGTESAGDVKKNVCPICRKGFTSKTWFNKHMEKEHSGNKFICTQCPKTFAKASQLSYHATSHSAERRFACGAGACHKRFKRRKQLATHMRTAHADARPFACDQCSMRFKLKSVLKSHMKVHEGVKQYLCYLCGWSFAQSCNLKVHMRKHTGEKPFGCSECGFRAAAASNLRRHQRRHAGARTYVCTHCRKGFYDASGLARHVRTHTGALPYRCGAGGCARAFRDSWKRKAHVMRVHRTPLQRIPRMRPDGTLLEHT